MDIENCDINKEYFNTLDKVSAKHEIKTKTNEAAFKYLKHEQSQHKKVKDISYPRFEIQNYLKSAKVRNQEADIITALRSRTLRGIKDNFHTQYSEDLNCNLCEIQTDTQEHCMICPKILSNIVINKEHIRYDHIYGTTDQHKEVAQLYLKLLKGRKGLLLEKESNNENGNQGLRLDPVPT